MRTRPSIWKRKIETVRSNWLIDGVIDLGHSHSLQASSASRVRGSRRGSSGESRQQNSAVKKKKKGKKDWWFYDMFVILTPVCTSFVRARDIYAFLCVLSVVKLCVRRIVFIHCRNHVTCLDHVAGNSDGFCYSCRVSECPTPCKAQR